MATAYRALLHVFSHVRMMIVHAMISNQCPFGDDGVLLREMRHVRDQLPGVLAGIACRPAGSGGHVRSTNTLGTKEKDTGGKLKGQS